jgi:tetratricopeptide (TPR) repeat protein
MRVGFSASTRGNNQAAAAAWSRANGSGHAEAAPLAAVNLGGLYWRLGDIDGALAAFEQASKSRHAHAAPWASVRLGLLRKQLGDAEGAAAAFEQAGASGHPDAAPLAALNLRLLRNQGNGQAGAPRTVRLTRLGDPGYARRAYRSPVESGHAQAAPVAASELEFLGEGR